MPKESEEIVVKKNNRLSFRLKNSLSVYLSIINQNKRLLILVVILLIIPVTVGLVLVQQEIRSRASGGDNYSPVKIRTAWINYKTGGDYDISDPELKAEIDKEVKNIRKQGLEIEEKLNKEKNRKYIFENEIDEKTRNVKKIYEKQDGGDGVVATYNRIELMALAYATKGALTDEERKRFYPEIKSALLWLNNNWYNDKTCLGDDGLLAYSLRQNDKSKCQESLLYQVDIPLALTSSILLIYNDLSKDPDFETFIKRNMNAVECFYPNPSGKHNNVNRLCKTPDGDEDHDTGANLAMISVPLLLRSGISKDKPAFEEVKQSYSKLLKYAVKDDGIYEDGSFIQHDKGPYNMWYGSIYIRKLTELSILLNESGLGGENNSRLYRFFKDSYQPFIFNNDPMDMVMGMQFKNPRAGDGKQDKIPLIETELQIVSFLTGDQYKDLGKDYLSKKGDVSTDSIYSIIKSYKLTKDPNLKTDNDYEITKLFPRMDRFVQVKKDYAFGISLSSKRIERYETVKSRGVNKRGWYMSDGLFYFYNKFDPAQYNDFYWAKINMTKLPGTTVDNTIKLKQDNTYSGDNYDQAFAQTSPPNNNAGGTVLDNKYAVVGMELKSAFNVNAYKTYFIFDDEVVAIGSGIRGSNDKEVETIVENRKIKDDKSNIFLIDDTLISGFVNKTNPKWAYLEGTGGYYFPKPKEGNIGIYAQKEARRGSWNQISNENKRLEDKELSPYKNFAEIIIKHGVNPKNEKYAYVFLPNKNQSDTQSYAQNPDIDVITNNTTAHVVKEKKLNITSANFWGGGNEGGIKTSGASSIIIDEEPDRVNISVADPTQSQNSIKVTLQNITPGGVISKEDGIKVDSELSSPIRLSVNTKDANGKSFKISLSKGSSTIPSPEPGEPSSAPEPEVPVGYLDSTTCEVSAGWACDEDDFQKPLDIQFYADGPEGVGTLVGTSIANLSREGGVSKECGGVKDHGFNFSTPESLRDGQEYKIYAYALDDSHSASKSRLIGAPKTLICGAGIPVTPSPEPLPVGCIRNKPTITYGDLDKSGKKLEVISYQITIKNNDTKACSERKIALDLDVPTTRWSYSPEFIKINPGQIKTVNLKIKSGKYASTGNKSLPLIIRAGYSDTEFSKATIIYNVVK